MKRTGMMMLLLVLVVSLLALYGCPKKTEESAAPEEQPKAVEKAPETAPAPAEAPKAAEPAPAPAAEAPKEAAAKGEAGLQPIYFDFDKSLIRDDAKAAMKAN